MKLRVVGIDPSLSNFGFAHGTYDTETGDIDVTKLVLAETAPASKTTAKVLRKNSDDLSRAKILFEAMQKETSEAIFAFIEVPVGSQSARAMASYGMCVGIIASCSIPFFQLNPTEVKVAATGSKYASKEEMINWATKLFPNANWYQRTVKGKVEFLNKNEHLADAVGAIHAGVAGAEFKQAVAMFKFATKVS